MPKILQSAYTNPYILETFLNRYIQFIDQDVRRSASPTFANLTITDSLNYGGVINRTSQEISDFQDNIILLNSGVDTTVTPLNMAGFEINRGANSSNAFLKYDNQSSTWNVGLDGISTNLLASIPKPIDAGLNNGTLIYNAPNQSFNVSNTFQNAMTFQQPSTYAQNSGIVFTSLPSGLTWFDGTTLTRNPTFDTVNFKSAPLVISGCGLQLSGSDFNVSGATSRIVFGNFDSASLQKDAATGALVVKNLNSNLTYPSLITDSNNDAVPTTGVPSVSLRSKGAIFANRSIYFGPQNNPSDAAPAVYQMLVTDISLPDTPILSIRNVLNTVAPVASTVLIDAGAGQTSECRFQTNTGANGYGFIQTNGSKIVIGSSDVNNAATYPVQLESPMVTMSGNLSVDQNLTVTGDFVQANGLDDIVLTLADAVNASTTTTSPTLIGAVSAQPSQGWFQITFNLMFVPQADNESSFVNVVLPAMTQNIQDLSHIFCRHAVRI